MTKYNNHIPKDDFRLHVYKRFYNLFPTTDSFQKIAINIERSIFNYSIIKLEMGDKLLNDLFKFIYIGKAVVIYRNLDRNHSLKNDYLYDKIVSGEINTKDLVHFSPEQMFPEKFAQILEKNKTEIVITGKSEVLDYEGLIKCFKCGSYKVSYYELQQRASDEPSSKICHCTVCSNNFKVF
jgi:DNA-directed RNA polymerase subunit M/transcription elongation factor TFIIS